MIIYRDRKFKVASILSDVLLGAWILYKQQNSSMSPSHSLTRRKHAFLYQGC